MVNHSIQRGPLVGEGDSVSSLIVNGENAIPLSHPWC